eukprot:936432-Pleurochrysis_carterae.AAC.1
MQKTNQALDSTKPDRHQSPRASCIGISFGKVASKSASTGQQQRTAAPRTAPLRPRVNRSRVDFCALLCTRARLASSSGFRPALERPSSASRVRSSATFKLRASSSRRCRAASCAQTDARRQKRLGRRANVEKTSAFLSCGELVVEASQSRRRLQAGLRKMEGRRGNH